MDKVSNLVNRKLRAGASALSFTLFGVGGLILSYLWFPLLKLRYRNKSELELVCQLSICRSFSFFTQFMHKLRILNIKTINIERLQSEEGCIVVANHPTLIDVVILMGFMRQCDCIVKSELFTNPFIQHVVKMAGFIPNRSDDLIEQCHLKLKEGRKLLVFPEGSRTVPGKDIKCQRGAAQLAVRCNSSFQTVRIHCSPIALYKGCAWHNMPASPMQFSIEADLPQTIQQFIKDSPAPATSARRLTRHFNRILQPTLVQHSNAKDIEIEQHRDTPKTVNY